MRVLLWVQHLLGIGHVRRAALIAAALAGTSGPDGEPFAVTVASGGFPVVGTSFGAAKMAQLPPVRAADPGFRVLLDEDGRPIDDGWRDRRRRALLRLAGEIRPDILVLETYPFGRRAFRFELEPLLGDAAGRTLVAASVRDILVRKTDPVREAAMAEDARRWLDMVLVHGDPALVPFEATFPPARRIADLIRYTGYVGPAAEAPSSAGTDGAGEVVVSVGGGAVGERLLRTALDARALTRAADRCWRLLVGPDLPAGIADALRQAAPPGVVVEPARPDFPALLGRCALSVSQAGYNTVMDVMAAGCRAVLVPFAAGLETEQTVRARLLAGRGLASIVEEASLTPERLAEAVDAALDAPAPVLRIPADGAARTVRLLAKAARVKFS